MMKPKLLASTGGVKSAAPGAEEEREESGDDWKWSRDPSCRCAEGGAK
jgi:hypothetical protein